MSSIVHPLPLAARTGVLTFGDGLLYPHAIGSDVFAPFAGTVHIETAKGDNDDFSDPDGIADARAFLRGANGIEVVFDAITLPRAILREPQQAGNLLGIASASKDGGFWIKARNAKTRKPIDTKALLAGKLTPASSSRPSPSPAPSPLPGVVVPPAPAASSGGAILLVAVCVGLFLWKGKK